MYNCKIDITFFNNLLIHLWNWCHQNLIIFSLAKTYSIGKNEMKNVFGLLLMFLILTNISYTAIQTWKSLPGLSFMENLRVWWWRGGG